MTEYIHTPEDKARHKIINPMLTEAGWTIQDFKNANIRAAKGVAVEYFHMGQGVGEADYVLFVNGLACGIIEAKKEGETLRGKEFQSGRYAEGFPEQFRSVPLPLPFIKDGSVKFGTIINADKVGDFELDYIFYYDYYQKEDFQRGKSETYTLKLKMEK